MLPQSKRRPQDLEEVGSLPPGAQGKPPSGPAHQTQGRGASLHREGGWARSLRVGLPPSLYNAPCRPLGASPGSARGGLCAGAPSSVGGRECTAWRQDLQVGAHLGPQHPDANSLT